MATTMYAQDGRRVFVHRSRICDEMASDSTAKGWFAWEWGPDGGRIDHACGVATKREAMEAAQLRVSTHPRRKP